MWIGMNSSLFIPWQNPSLTSLCHRLAIETVSRNVTLLLSRSLFGEASFNLSLTNTGPFNISLTFIFLLIFLTLLRRSYFDIYVRWFVICKIRNLWPHKYLKWYHSRYFVLRILNYIQTDGMHNLISHSLLFLQVDEQIAFNIAGNFSYFKSFNVWQLMDESELLFRINKKNRCMLLCRCYMTRMRELILYPRMPLTGQLFPVKD